MGERINSTYVDYSGRIDSAQDIALAAIILGTIGISLAMIIITYWICRKRKARWTARKKELSLDIKRSVAEHEHLINNLSVRLRDAMKEFNQKLEDKGSPVDLEEILCKSDTVERILNAKLSDNALSIEPAVNSDIISLENRVITLETTTDNLVQELRRISGASELNLKPKPPFAESPAAKGLQSYQNNRMFEEIMAYRGKIVNLEKKDAETQRQLKSLQQKVAIVMTELNIIDENHVEERLFDTVIASNISFPALEPNNQSDTHRKSKHFSWAKTIQADPSPGVKSPMVQRIPLPIIKKLVYPSSPIPVDVSIDTEMNTYLNARLTELTGTGNLSGRCSEEEYFPKTSSSDSLQRKLSFDLGSDSHLQRTISKSRAFEKGSDADYGLEILKGSNVDEDVKLSKSLIADVGSDSHEGRVIISRKNSYDSNVDTYDRFGTELDCSESSNRILNSSASTVRRISGRETVMAMRTTFSISNENVVEESDPLLGSEC